MPMTKKTVYGKTNIANVISLRQLNRHVPIGMQGMATKSRRRKNMDKFQKSLFH